MKRALLVTALLVGCGGNVVEGTSPDASTDGAVTDTSTVDAPPGDTAGRFDRCDGPAQCVLAPVGCCSKCGPTEITDFDAIQRDQVDAHHAAVCPVPESCPKCASMIGPNLVALCRAERCVGVDLRQDVLSECATDADCTMRAGSGCCESCAVASASELVALNVGKVGALAALVCDPLAGACPPCMPVYPASAKAVCDPSSKHCRIAAP
jgi:hypothetical protein